MGRKKMTDEEKKNKKQKKEETNETQKNDSTEETKQDAPQGNTENKTGEGEESGTESSDEQDSKNDNENPSDSSEDKILLEDLFPQKKEELKVERRGRKKVVSYIDFTTAVFESVNEFLPEQMKLTETQKERLSDVWDKVCVKYSDKIEELNIEVVLAVGTTAGIILVKAKEYKELKKEGKL